MRNSFAIFLSRLFTFAIVCVIGGCASNQSGANNSMSASQRNADARIRSVAFDPDKFNRATVATTIADVFAGQGYKSTFERPRAQQGVQIGAGGTMTPIGGEELGGPIQSVATDMQPPITGLGTTSWFYRATIGHNAVTIAVFQEFPPGSFFAAAGAAEAANWVPPNMDLVLQQLRQRLQPSDSTATHPSATQQ